MTNLQSGLKTTATLCVLLALALSASAQLDEPEHTINLKGLLPRYARATGLRLVVSFTNLPPEFSSVLKSDPTPVQKRESSVPRRKVQVRFGADILGDAEFSGSWRQPMTANNKHGPQLATFHLTFETVEQAARTSDALRQNDAIPRPLQGPGHEARLKN